MFYKLENFLFSGGLKAAFRGKYHPTILFMDLAFPGWRGAQVHSWHSLLSHISYSRPHPLGSKKYIGMLTYCVTDGIKPWFSLCQSKHLHSHESNVRRWGLYVGFSLLLWCGLAVFYWTLAAYIDTNQLLLVRRDELLSLRCTISDISAWGDRSCRLLYSKRWLVDGWMVGYLGAFFLSRGFGFGYVVPYFVFTKLQISTLKNMLLRRYTVHMSYFSTKKKGDKDMVSI